MVATRNNAPPQILALLWHHFCYYKRHRSHLVYTILLPFLCLVLLYFLTNKLLPLVSKPYQHTDCQFLTKSPFSSGPLQAVLSSRCESNLHTQINQTCVNYGDMNVLDIILSGKIPDCLKILSSQNISAASHNVENETSYKFQHPCGTCSKPRSKLCLLLQEKILYFPNTESFPKEVMKHVTETLRNYAKFFGEGPAAASAQIEPEKRTIIDVIQSVISEHQNCSIEPAERVLGFQNRQAVRDYMTELSKNASIGKNESESDAENIWGVVSFEEDDVRSSADHLTYRIIYDSQYSHKMEPQIPLLQDLVENAIIQQKSGRRKLPLAIGTKAFPNKCWTAQSGRFYQLLRLLVQCMVLTSFIYSPMGFLEQVLIEKSLKLREYLYIMGIGEFKLKFSWILFYCIFLMPLSLVFAFLITIMPETPFERSDPSLIFILVIMYNVSLLSFCYLLACTLESPQYAEILMNFIFFITFTLTIIIYGRSAVLSRICCLCCVTPMLFAIAYFIDWEAELVGAQWRNFFYSPNPTDEFGGFGECFLWLVADTVLYIVLAWYFEQVAPGEYGIKWPPYFFLLPSYWCPSKQKNEYEPVALEELADVESPPEGAEAGVTLTELTKLYGKEKIGINKLSLRFFKGEVTAFLGENGAGKSTTLNTLVGLISATDGSAAVHEFDTHSQMGSIRKIVGFVPQHDILYPSMTVQEHLQFFGWLKGLSKAETSELTEPLLTRLGLTDQKNIITTKLSGGEKRKLSVLTAYLGDPEVIILDEPTSGVDPFSRRTIWEMILSRGRTGTTILSTHFMEEADILGDRIAIIADGELRCSGTAMYLKNKYGKGLRLTASCNSDQENKAPLKQFFADSIPESKVVQETGLDVMFVIPVEVARSQKMTDFLKKFEECYSDLSVVSYGLSEPTLEEVLFSATKSQHVGNVDRMEFADRTDDNVQTSDMIFYHTPQTFYKFAWQAWGLMQKRAFCSLLAPSAYALQIGMPLCFIILLFLGGKKSKDSGAAVRDVHIYKNYRENIVFFQDASETANTYILSAVSHGLGPRCPLGLEGFSCDGSTEGKSDKLLKNPNTLAAFAHCSCSEIHCVDKKAADHPSELIPSKDKLYRVGSGTNLTDWLIHINSSHQTPVGGFQFLHLNPGKWNRFLADLETKLPKIRSWIELINETTILDYVTIWHKNNLESAMMNIWNNLALKTLTENTAGMQMELESASLIETQKGSEADSQDYSSIFNHLSYLNLCFVFGTLGIAVLVQYENTTGLKRMQFLFGANPIIYWIVNLIFDFLLYMVTVAVAMILLAAFDNVFQDSLGVMLVVVIPFGYLSITFTYLLTFIFKGTKGIVVFTLLTLYILLFVAFYVSSLEIKGIICLKQCNPSDSSCTDECTKHTWAAPVASILRIFPPYFISDGLILVVFWQISNNKSLYEPLLGMDFFGRRILTACLAGTVYFTLVLILECFDLRIKWKFWRKPTKAATNPITHIDPDVEAEVSRVNGDPNLSDPLVLKNLSKTFRGSSVPAVAGVTLGVPQSQCFGLLGVNGAGKTTLFRMLTGFLQPTTGGATLEGKDLFTRGWGRLEGASYCPQEKTLFDQLNVARHLKLFSMIRGIPRSCIVDVIACLADEAGLTPQLSKKPAELSGGNQRKLQLALALLGYCPVIFLDEPTTGMDPAAKRMAWSLIQRAVGKGCSVVLTSHSMEECEVLCHRLVIMVAGSFQCIGSVQYLKDKQGNTYTYRLKMSSSDRKPAPCESVKSLIMDHFPASTLIEENSSVLLFQVPAAGLVLSELFRVLNQCRNELQIEDFTVTQTTLEHIFINLAKMQEIVQLGSGIQNVCGLPRFYNAPTDPARIGSGDAQTQQ